MLTLKCCSQLRERRKELGLTLEEVAQKVGVSTNYISLIERCKNVPSDDIIIKLARVLQIDEVELFLVFNKVPPSMIEELKNNSLFREAIKLLSQDSELDAEDRNKLYQKLIYWYCTMEKEKRERN